MVNSTDNRPSSGDEITVDADVALAILDAAPDCMLLVGPDGRILVANQAASDLFDHSFETLVEMTVEDLLPESLKAAHAKHRQTYGRRPRRREMGSGLELVGMKADGTMVPVEISLSPLRIQGIAHVIVAVRDVTRRRADEEALTAARRHLTTTTERERIGRDLHDTVLQRLYGAGLGLQAALTTDDATLRKRAERASEEIDDTITEIRSVIFDLNRVSSGEGSLAEQIKQLANEMAETYGFEPTVQVVDYVDTALDAELADAVIAVLHESLSNTGRHSGAGKTLVSVEVDADGVLLVEVTDDGCGFDVNTAPRGKGLDNLARRAQDFGGSAKIVSYHQTGTTVQWQVPIGAVTQS